MITVSTFNYLQQFEFLGRPNIQLPPFRQFLMDKVGDPEGLSDMKFSRIHLEYREKLEEASPHILKSLKHCTLIAGPACLLFDGIIINLQSLTHDWDLSVFVRDKNGQDTEILNKWDLDISWDGFLMCKIDLAPYLHMQFKKFNLNQDQELCIQLRGAVMPVGSAMVGGTDINYSEFKVTEQMLPLT